MFSLKAIIAGLAISGLVFASSAASYAADSTTTTVKPHHGLKAHAGVKGHKVTGKRHAAKAGHRRHGKLGAHRGVKAGQAKGNKGSHVGKQHGRQVQTHRLTNGGSRMLA